MIKYKAVFFFVYLCGGILVSSTVVLAGSLTPSFSPAPSTHTLSDVYNKLTNNSYTASIPGLFSFPTGVASSTMRTVEQIWNAIPTISSSTIISGNTILGVAGAYNILNLTVEKVASGTSYGTSSIGTMLSGNPLYTRASLEWSPNLGPMTWALATGYCSYYGDRINWRLPTIYELNVAIDNQRLGITDSNLTPGGFITIDSTAYWSLTEGTDVPSDISAKITTKAKTIIINSADGIVIDEIGILPSTKTGSKYFRCVK